jgi:Asp-tRNA(Asn)/Glu-tRNA(Gln) amidotransferase A subunit family amidase/Asp-tRNA(Asn)/Glu-tRNA(Gln) amidotransferase C subunit
MIEHELMPADATPDRRHFLKALTALGVGTAAFQRSLAAQVERAREVTPEMIQQAEWVAGLDLTDEERKATARSLQQLLGSFEALRKVDVGYDVAPALTFNPAPWLRPAQGVQRNQAAPIEWRPPRRPDSDEDLAFLPVTELSALVRSRQVSSTELTRLYLDRLKKYDPLLRCVVTLTEETALEQAGRADAEIAVGRYRGPLHGIPWGAKDLIAYPNYKTTWGAPPFIDQSIDVKATVAERLEEAGAVMVAKLTLGALAMGDRWFGGMTRNPWDPRRGSSGSSAGSASTVAAGLVGFAIGSETLGSIVSPSRECGTTGLRPTFGRISRHGCMALSWTMDKLGPICRSAEDCALVLDAIHGWDGRDSAAVDQPFAWPPQVDLKGLKVGYFKGNRAPEDRDELQVLKKLGVTLVEVSLPRDYPAQAVTLMLGTEAATAFDKITREHVTEGLNSWPDTFRRGQFVPAVEYLRAARVRTLLMGSMRKLMDEVHMYVGEGQDLAITNLTGHPCVALPTGFRDQEGRRVPRVSVITGRLFDETTLLAVAHAYQQASGFHLQRPDLEKFLREDVEAKKAEAGAEKI